MFSNILLFWLILLGAAFISVLMDIFIWRENKISFGILFFSLVFFCMTLVCFFTQTFDHEMLIVWLFSLAAIILYLLSRFLKNNRLRQTKNKNLLKIFANEILALIGFLMLIGFLYFLYAFSSRLYELDKNQSVVSRPTVQTTFPNSPKGVFLPFTVHRQQPNPVALLNQELLAFDIYLLQI